MILNNKRDIPKAKKAAFSGSLFFMELNPLVGLKSICAFP